MRPWIFPGIVFALLGTNMTIVGITIYASQADQSFGVEPDYYQKAVHWDDTSRQHQENKRLGWRVELSVTRVQAVGQSSLLAARVLDSQGNRVAVGSIRVTAFSNLRSSDRRKIVLSPGPDDVFSAPIEIDRPGLWHFDVIVDGGGATFTSSLEQDVTSCSMEPGQ